MPAPANFVSGEAWEWRQIDAFTRLETGKLTRTVENVDGTLLFSDGMKRFEMSALFVDGGNLQSSKPWRVWPLEVGKKWSVNVDWSRPDGVTGNTKQEAEVVAYEEVVVPAGKFMAFKIEQRGWFQNSRPNRGKQNDTYWYAPEAKADVKHVRDDSSSLAPGLYTRELVRHKRGEP